MNKELQNLLTDLENFIYQSEKDKFTLDVHQVHLILDHIANQGEKIEKQDNIINELEKYINETKLEEFEIVYGRRYGKTFTQAEVIICNMILNKLKELKGNNND
jgi:predicted RNA methylase